jgi:hypothetical protein
MRVSSVMFMSPSSGTLKSHLTRTVLPVVIIVVVLEEEAFLRQYKIIVLLSLFQVVLFPPLEDIICHLISDPKSIKTHPSRASFRRSRDAFCTAFIIIIISRIGRR